MNLLSLIVSVLAAVVTIVGGMVCAVREFRKGVRIEFRVRWRGYLNGGVCFERGTASEILASERALLQRDRSVKKVVELKCPSSDHVFRAKVSPMAFRKAYKLVD